MPRSITQMTKAELRAEVERLNTVIADLNHRIDELEGMAIQSAAQPLNADASRMLSNLHMRVKELEEQINEQNKL